MSGTPRLLFTLFPNHGRSDYSSGKLHPQNNCTQTRFRSVQHAVDTKFATKNSRSLSTSVLQRSALQSVLWMQLCHISSGICHDSIITHLICCLAYLMFLVCSKYLNIVIHLDLSQCLDNNFKPLGQAVDLDVEVVGSHRLFCRTGHD